MPRAGTDSHDDDQDGCENGETAHRSILWRMIRRLCHGSSSKLSGIDMCTQWANCSEPQPAQNQQIHRGFKNRNVRFRPDVSRNGQDNSPMQAFSWLEWGCSTGKWCQSLSHHLLLAAWRHQPLEAHIQGERCVLLVVMRDVPPRDPQA